MMRVLKIFILIGFLNAMLVPFSRADEIFTKLQDVVVTANKYETSVKDIPASITVITEEDIETQHLPNSDMGDVLRSIPGITLRRAYSPFPAYPNIRGMGSEATVILVNGIPTNWEITQAIPPENIERIEIVRGPASALYGANASGGVINIITKEGGEELKSLVGAGYGTFDTYRLNAATNGRLDKLGFSLAASREESDGTNVVKNNVVSGVHMIEDCEYDKKAFSLNTDYRFTDASKISLFYNFSNHDYTRGRPYVGGDWDRHFASIIYDQELGESFALKGSLGYRYDDLLHLYDTSDYKPRQKRYTDYYSIPVELQLTGKIGGGHTLTMGLFYDDQKTEQEYSDWVTGDLVYKNRYKVRTQAAYLQDSWKPVVPLTITAGVRYDHWKNYDNFFGNYTDQYPEDRTDDNWSPKLGVKYNLTDATSIWANYGTGFTPPSSTQLYDDRTSGGNPRQPNPDLEPEETQAYEIGVDHWFGAMARTKLAGFYNQTDDKILSWFNADNVWVNKNIGRTISYGAELDLTLYLSEFWLINANYTWNKAEIDDNPSNPDYEGNEVPFSPEHKANLKVSYSDKNNITASLFFRYLDEQHTNDANIKYTDSGEEKFMDESFVVDLKVTKHLPVSLGALTHIDLSLSIDNIFDEDYRSYYMYEDPGTVYFGEVSLIF